MKNAKNNQFYVTKDQQIASLLYATGQTLDSTYWESGVCFFVWENKTECEKIVCDYYKGKVKINAKILFEGLRTIKDIIYSK